MLLCVNCISQTPVFENFTTENGLISDCVYSVFQDKDGSIWSATNNGISNFNGASFTNYNISDGLSDKEVMTIFSDQKGRIWFLGFNGSVCFYFQNKIHNRLNTPWLKKINSTILFHDFYVDDSSLQNIYFLNKNTCYQLDSSNQVTTVSKTNNDTIAYLSILKLNNKLHIICTDKLIEINGKKSLFQLKHCNTNYKNYMFHHSNNQNLIYTNDRLSVINYSLRNNEVIYQFNTKHAIQAIFQTGSYVFIATSGGLYQISKLNNTSKFIFEGVSVTNIIEDYQGGIWFGSTNKGIIHIPNDKITFTESENKTDFKKCDLINDHFYLFSSVGNIYEKKSDKILLKYQVKKNTLNQIYSVKKVNSKSVYFCTTGIVELNNLHQTFLKHLSAVSIKDIEFENDSAYVALSYGVLKTSKKTLLNDARGLYYNEEKTKQIIFEYTRFLIKHNQQILAFGTYGLKLITNNTAIAFKNKHPLFHNQINDVRTDSNNNIFIASSGFGIAKLNLNSNDETVFNVPTDLLNSSGLYIDKDNHLWVLASQGIYKFNEKRNIFEKFIDAQLFLNNKLLDFVVTDISILAISKNKLFTIPLDFRNTITKPKSVYFTAITFNDKPVNDSFISLTKEAENVLRFNFKSISFKNKLQYKYILRGVDKEIHYTSSNEIRYTSLPEGEYEFEISACDAENKNIYSSSRKIKIIISEPWFKSLWLKFLGGFILLTTTILYFRFRYNRLKAIQEFKNSQIENHKNRAIMEKDLVQLEQKALLAQMNPHFIFNSLNTMQSFYLTGDTKNATIYLNLFSKLLRNILNVSSKEFISLEKEKELMMLYAELINMKLQQPFIFKFNIDKKIDAFETLIPSMIIQPFLENALLHGITNHADKGLVCINIIYDTDDSVKIEIIDNGIGREAAKKNKIHTTYESKGLEITQKRIFHLNSNSILSTEINFIDLKNEDGNAIGTQVDFFLICKYNY